MGDANQLTYLKRMVPTVDGPVLEVGSREVGSTSGFRDFYRGVDYVGIDIQAGEGVNYVIDIAAEMPEAVPIGRAGMALVICCSVLEHVANPWLAAKNLTMLTRTGGEIYVSVPWVWRYHAYPDDYWRFSWRGVQLLFPDFEWHDPAFSTNVPGEFFKALPGADDALAGHVGERKYIPYLMVNMIGRKR